jgi:RNA polymerase sigma-70 factor (ECF subfamily)
LVETQQTALVDRCKGGDREAFRDLLQVYHGILFGTAYLMTRDRDLAEDIVQEASVKIWTHLPSLKVQSSLKAWMVRVVVNEVKQELRKRQLPVVRLEDAPDAAGDPDEALADLLREDEREGLREALDALPAEQRDAIVLRHFSGLTIPEIAAAMGRREGTIKSRLSRAIARLHEVMRRDEAWEGRGYR